MTNKLRISAETLAVFYESTVGEKDVSAVFYRRLDHEFDQLGDDSHERTDNRLQRLIEHKLANGTLVGVEKEPRAEEEIMQQIAGIVKVYPWLGSLSMRRNLGVPSPDSIEASVGNHAFDDSPLPYGISEHEGHILRDYMHDDMQGFRTLAELLFKPQKVS